MKKNGLISLLGVVSVSCISVLAIAGNLTNIPVDAGIKQIKDTVNANNDIINSGTLTGTAITVTGALTGEQLTSTDDALIGDDLTVSGLVSVTESVSAEQLTSTDDALVSDDLTVSGKVTVVESVSSYGYTAVVGHTNGSSQVWMTQAGSVVGGGETTKTQAFSVVYIATPYVVVTSSDAASATNAPYLGTVASNQFTVVTDGVGTNFNWISHGRIK